MKRAALLCLLCSPVAACSDDAGELRRVALGVSVQGMDPAAISGIDTPLGWNVTLSAAELSVAAVYFRNAAPTSGTTDDQGRVVAQVLGPFTIDALDPEPRWLDLQASALSERVRSAELWLTEDLDGPIAGALGAGRALVHLAGTATRASADGGDETIAFDGGLSLPLQNDSRAYETWINRRIRRLSADFVPVGGEALTIAVDPSRFLDAVPFDALGPADGTREFSTAAEQVQLRNGIANANGYGFGLQVR